MPRCKVDGTGSGWWMKRIVIIYGLMCAVLLALVMPLLPFQDDWTYLTAPNPDFAWRDLLPGAAFWRPFDALWGGMLGCAPGLFPWANRIAIVLGHVLCVYLVARIVDELQEDRRGRSAAVGFFALSSGIAAVIVNTDSLNLVWSCVWGGAGTLALLRGRSLLSVFGCYAVSVLCKESGLSWLAVGPLLVYAKDSDGRRLVKFACMGACVFAFYLWARFALQGEVVLGNGGDYALTLSPKTIGVNLSILAGLSVSGADALAFVSHRYVLFGASAVLSIVAWCAFAACADAGRGKVAAQRLFVCAAMILAFAAPHCLFKNHHPAEMHFYPVVLGTALALALIPMNYAKRMPVIVSVSSMCAVFAIGWFDKMTAIYESSARAEALLAEVRNSVPVLSVPSVYRVKGAPEVVRYSVFSQPAIWCLGDGSAFRRYNGWRESKVALVEE